MAFSDPFPVLTTMLSGVIPGATARVSALVDAASAIQAAGEGWPFWVQTLDSVASIVISLALIVIAVALIGAALGLRKIYRRVDDILGKIHTGVDPAIRHTNDVADNVNYITTAIRSDVAQLQDTVARANQRLNRAADMAEARIQDFNGLLKVVQEEAEDLFIHSAATVRGMREGRNTFRRLRTGESRVGGTTGGREDRIVQEDELGERRDERHEHS